MKWYQKLHWKIIIGLVLGIICFAKLIPFLFKTYPSFIKALFLGIMIASIRLPLKLLNNKFN